MAIACVTIRSRMILFAYFRLNSPPRAKETIPAKSTRRTTRLATTAAMNSA